MNETLDGMPSGATPALPVARYDFGALPVGQRMSGGHKMVRAAKAWARRNREPLIYAHTGGSAEEGWSVWRPNKRGIYAKGITKLLTPEDKGW
jgi:hypothetical protein